VARIPLKGGAYTARSVIANCQRSVNLYGEPNPEDAPCPFTYYPTPGLRLLANAPTPAAGRGLYRASNGALYAVVGANVYFVDPSYNWTKLGTLTTSTGQTSMADNQSTAVLVDGSAKGYTIQLASNAWAAISSSAFYGADRVAFQDTFFVFNKPSTGQFYVSGSNATTFDPLYFATKIGASDRLATLAVVHRELWLLGDAESSEIWINSGATTFPFELMNGAFVQHGCGAKYSVAQMGDAIFWLGVDKQGGNVVLKGQGYQAERISTHAIETALSSYSTTSDAIGYTYQQEGHQFYVLTFPTADKTWCFDLITGQWHERVWLDTNGAEHRHRGVSAAYCYGSNIVQDWETGALYAFDLNTYTDNGTNIIRRRGFPHMGSNGNRVFYRQFIADMEVGRAVGAMTQISYTLATEGGALIGTETGAILLAAEGASAQPPALSLRYSDTRGAMWSDPITDDLGASGDFLKSIQFQRLGMARDRVFELFWSGDVKTALNGAFIETTVAKS